MRAVTASTIVMAFAFLIIESFMASDGATAQTGCGIQLLTSNAVHGSWTSDCPSQNRENSYARFYSLRLTDPAEVTIALESETDPYLFLHTEQGEFIAENDDIDYDARNFNSHVVATLERGDYTIEATTYSAGATGDFTLTVESDAIGDPTPPTPTPTPSPTPAPGNPIPAGCVLQSISDSGFTIDDAWTSDCVSRNRVASGDHYAKFYGFTVDRTSSIDITLVSRTDTYMFLLDEYGRVVEENDDYDHNIFDLRARSSGIRITLDPGNYIIEATTYANEATGDFTLTIASPDITALRALYHATNGANWTNNDNWLTDAPLSEWHGITTDDEGSVTEIYLIDNNLVGTIPAELGGMHSLEGLYLARNQLSGTIPPELGNLHNLETLMMFRNELSGTIPPELGNLASLEELHMGRNRLSGHIPVTLGNLQSLTRLHLTVNELRGGIPASLGNLTELRQLSIASNNLSGPIPTDIADLSNLTHIYLWGNDLLAGRFVNRLDSMTELRFLDIGGNNIDGEDVLAELYALHNLTGLGVHDSGITDDDMSAHMDDLQTLDLEFLNLSGNNLADLQTLVKLSEIETIQRLAIHGNDLSGELPRTMTRLTLMRLLYFHANPGLCAPADNEFQDWLRGIRDVKGDTCTGGNPTDAPAQQSSGDEFAATMSAAGSAEDNHSLLSHHSQPAGGG